MEGESSIGSRRVAQAAFLANSLIAILKFTVAVLTGSTALLAEGFHSLADTANQLFLLIGLRLSSRPPDLKHPFGYGKEGYFWAFVVSISILVVGATFSIHEGVQKVLQPTPLAHEGWAYLVLLLSGSFEFYAWRAALKELRPSIKKQGVLGAIRESKAPAIFIVFLEDTSAMIGLFIAFWGILLSNLLDNPLFDGVASVIIGALLAAVALLVSYETRSLLIGEGISKEDLQKVRKAIASVPEVQEVMDILTMHLAPDDVLVNLNINFADGLTTDQVEEAIDKVERAVQQALPSVKRIFVEAESLKKTGPLKDPSPTPPGD